VSGLRDALDGVGIKGPRLSGVQLAQARLDIGA